MKQTAIEAVRTLAGWIYDGATFAWPLVDRIERRWRIQGSAEAFIKRWTDARAEFLKAQSKRHDAMRPDRLTYLHR